MTGVLTIIPEPVTITSVGKTEAGNAEEQPARYSRLRATNSRRGGRSELPYHLTIRKDNSELCNA